MPDISQITLPSGSTYNIKDNTARQDIEELRQSITGGVHYLGPTTTALTDGATTNPITISGNSHSCANGDLVNYGDKEFLWDGSKWNEMGDLGAFKALAYKDNASGTYTPAGTVSQPTFSGTPGTVSVTGAVAGDVSQPTFTGTQGSVSVSGTPTGNVTIGSDKTGVSNYTPEGSVEISSSASGTANYVPGGVVSTPSITVTPSVTTVNSITAVGTLPAFTATVSNENLSLSWDAGALPTKGSDTTVATGIESATSSQPTFTGTGARLEASFTGTDARIYASFTGTAFNSTGTFTPEGVVSKPVFDSDGVTATGTFTPEGVVSRPTFTGTQATITVS